ncbi:MAG: recombinase family protein, partial [Methylocella sp.]
QQFNTTTSMGRLTLNMLLSFAQFEREIAGERIRDKIAASKKKGMWMGGNAPLGYDVKERKLVVSEAEASTVRMIFQRYAELGSVALLKAELERAGIVSKRREGADGELSSGKRFSRGALYLMLQNWLYRGNIAHKEKIYPGQHQAIIEPELWQAVQDRLAAGRRERSVAVVAEAPSLLAGLIFDSEGNRRYHWLLDEKARIAAETLAPGARMPRLCGSTGPLQVRSLRGGAASRQGGRTRSEADARQRDDVFSGLAGIGPKDTLEAMIAAQMLACHGAAIECFRYALATNRAPVAL